MLSGGAFRVTSESKRATTILDLSGLDAHTASQEEGT